jgi:hypothetical protein
LTVSETIQDRILAKLHAAWLEGGLEKVCHSYELAEQLGLTRDEFTENFAWLSHKDLAKQLSIEGPVRITHKGVLFAQERRLVESTQADRADIMKAFIDLTHHHAGQPVDAGYVAESLGLKQDRFWAEYALLEAMGYLYNPSASMTMVTHAGLERYGEG